MAIQRRIPMEHGSVFPHGAYLVGDVEPVHDFNASKREDGSRPQQVDADSGLLMWSVPVLDADPEAGRRNKTVTVKLMAKHQPVPPENTSWTPFCPVEFTNLVVVPWIDDNSQRPRLAWSFRASEMVKPGDGPRVAGGPKAAA